MDLSMLNPRLLGAMPTTYDPKTRRTWTVEDLDKRSNKTRTKLMVLTRYCAFLECRLATLGQTDGVTARNFHRVAQQHAAICWAVRTILGMKEENNEPNA